MEIIPFPFHIAALCGLVVLAAHRRNLFPFVLSFMYAAFFYLIHLSESYAWDLWEQLLVTGTLTAILFDVAISGPRIKYIKSFCLLMVLSILNNILMLVLSPIESGAHYVAAQASTAFISASLSLAEFYVLMRIIYGIGRGEPIFANFIVYIMAGISSFKPLDQALPSSIWQKGSTYNGHRTAEQDLGWIE
jgi:hypothetical protein